jgi:penicillin-binding protein 1B
LSFKFKRTILKRIFQFLFICFVLILVVAVGGIGVGAGLVSAYTKDEKIRTKEDFDKELNGLSQISYAYFRPADGKEQPQRIGELVTADYRILIHNLNEINSYLHDAFISVEDRAFYEHHGIVPKAIARAAYQQYSGSKITTGGSTITQQLIKNRLFTSDKTNQRKAKEIVNAIRLERYYSKEQIFVAYMNSVYFGRGAHGKNIYGVASAAKGIFQRNVKELNLAQAAYIAGMVQRPNDYIPYGPHQEKNLQRGLKRMKRVLDMMLLNQKISKRQYEEALTFDIKKSLAKASDFTNAYEVYPYIISAVEREVMEILKAKDPHPEGKDDNDYRKEVTQAGYHIYTTIDQKLYDTMNHAVQDLNFPTKKILGKVRREQVGAVLLENKTGAVLSFYAGNNFKENEKDFALVAKNQPGSAIKPLLAYGPALDLDIISPDSILIDEPIKKAYSAKVYENADGRYDGEMTATHALTFSKNTVAVKIFRKVGQKRGFNYLRQMGIYPHPWDGEASVLGGVREGFTVEQMTAAYAMIANHGVYHKPHLIERIIDAKGREIYNYSKENKAKQVFSPRTASQLTQMLREVVTKGTATRIHAGIRGNYPVAGKTGTSSSQYDLWFIGYTPEVTLGTWSGYDYNAQGNKYLAKDAWVRFFNATTKAKPDLIKPGY